jgi:hypothetical protein
VSGSRRRARRLLHLGPVAGTIAHHGFELAAGVGLVFQPYLGLAGASAAWGLALPAWVGLATRAAGRADDGPGGEDALLALLAGASLAGAALHFALWPVGRRPLGAWIGFPVLTEAEGLSPEQLPAYNAILYCWGLSTVVALAAGTPRRSRRWALVGFASWLPLQASARHHFEWLDDQRRLHPACWNRAAKVS